MPWHAYSFLTVTFFFCCLSYRKRKSLVCPTSWRTKGLGWLGERRRRGGDLPVPGAIQGEGCCTLPTVRQCTEGFLMFPPNSNSVSKNMSNPFKTFFFFKSYQLYMYAIISQYQEQYNGIYKSIFLARISSDHHRHSPATQELLSLSPL